MSFSDFTSLYGTTQKAKFWCDYMTGLRGQLEALNSSRARETPAPSAWSRVATREVLLYDVLYGEYFPAVGKCRASTGLHWFYYQIFSLERNPLTTNSFLAGSDPDPPEVRLPYCPVHSKIYGHSVSRTSRIS